MEYALYSIFAILVLMHWWVAKGKNINQLLDAADKQHHRVRKVIESHPKGGSWKEYKKWLREVS